MQRLDIEKDFRQRLSARTHPPWLGTGFVLQFEPQPACRSSAAPRRRSPAAPPRGTSTRLGSKSQSAGVNIGEAETPPDEIKGDAATSLSGSRDRWETA